MLRVYEVRKCVAQTGRMGKYLIRRVAPMQGKQVTVDELLPDVLLFPPGTDLHDHPLVTSSRLVLQARLVAIHPQLDPGPVCHQQLIFKPLNSVSLM